MQKYIKIISIIWIILQAIGITAAFADCIPDIFVTAPGAWDSSTCGAGDDCDIPGLDSEDHIYEVFLSCPGIWTFSLCNSSFDTKIGVGTMSCSTDVGYNDDFDCGIDSTQSQFTDTLPAGLYYVTVDGNDSACGDYVLEIYRTPDPGDNCDNPIRINLPEDAPYIDAHQTTCCRYNDYYFTCLGFFDTGEDIIYEVTVTEEVTVDITLNPKRTAFTGILINGVCPEGIYCIESSTNIRGSSHGITGLTLAPGAYYIMIDSWPPPTCIPDFDLTIDTVLAPDFTVTAPGTWNSNTCIGGDDCDMPGLDAEDLVYEVTLPCDGIWTFSLCGSSYDTKMGLGTACCSYDIGYNDDFDCGIDSTQSQITDTLAAGIYYVTVDGNDHACGEYTLEISRKPEVGDNCDYPLTITLPADIPYLDSDQTTCCRYNDYSSTCLGSYDGGEDIIYEVTVTETITVDIILDPKGTGWSGILIDDGCPLDSFCIAFSASDAGYAYGIRRLTLSPGSYYIMIDNYPAPYCIPDFDLSIDTAAIYTCIPDLSAEAPGTWVGNTCGAINDCYLRESEDYIYEIDIPEPGVWEFSLCSSDPAFNSYIYIGTTCCGDEIGFDDDGCGYTSGPSQLAASIPAGTYYVTIESFSPTDCGNYVLDIYKVCMPDFVVTAPGVWDSNTCGAGNDCNPGSPWMGGEDHIYEVFIPDSGLWIFSLCGSAYDTKIGIGTSCCSTDVGYNDDYCGLQSEVTVSIPSGTYYVVVDGFGSACGDYTLQIGDSTTSVLGICMVRNVWVLDTIAPGNTRSMDSSEVLIIENCGTSSIDLGLRFLTVVDTAAGDTIAWIPGYSISGVDTFSLHAIFNDNILPPEVYVPTTDMVGGSVQWATDIIYGSLGFGILPGETDNLWLEFVAPTHSSSYDPLRIEIELQARLFLP
ncbi:hypothetical protein JXI42_00285 [bacterium]|nr:hypothetical protein [bacterium]